MESQEQTKINPWLTTRTPLVLKIDPYLFRANCLTKTNCRYLF
jgi:hypothetical protein